MKRTLTEKPHNRAVAVPAEIAARPNFADRDGRAGRDHVKDGQVLLLGNGGCRTSAPIEIPHLGVRETWLRPDLPLGEHHQPPAVAPCTEPCSAIEFDEPKLPNLCGPLHGDECATPPCQLAAEFKLRRARNVSVGPDQRVRPVRERFDDPAVLGEQQKIPFDQIFVLDRFAKSV